MHLLTIDITNAFNSLPWPVISDAMKKAGIASNIREYIMNYLQFRWSPRVGQTKCGLAQGSALSSFLYCLSTDIVLQILSQKYEIVAYADDILIGVDNSNPVESIIDEI